MKCGCIKSKLDGTELLYKEVNKIIPSEFSYERILPEALNQGDYPICVPCSLSIFLDWDCNIHNNVSKVNNKVNLSEIYSIRKQTTDGMEIKEALSYLKNHGVSSNKGTLKITLYAKIGNPISLKQAIIANGPCIGGLPVYSNSKYFWKKEGNFQGGHAVAIIGFNKRGFIIRNSWGKAFGSNGNTILPYEDFNNFFEIWTIIN